MKSKITRVVVGMKEENLRMLQKIMDMDKRSKSSVIIKAVYEYGKHIGVA